MQIYIGSKEEIEKAISKEEMEDCIKETLLQYIRDNDNPAFCIVSEEIDPIVFLSKDSKILLVHELLHILFFKIPVRSLERLLHFSNDYLYSILFLRRELE